jgi:hypothetical protein
MQVKQFLQSVCSVIFGVVMDLRFAHMRNNFHTASFDRSLRGLFLAHVNVVHRCFAFFGSAVLTDRKFCDFPIELIQMRSPILRCTIGDFNEASVGLQHAIDFANHSFCAFERVFTALRSQSTAHTRAHTHTHIAHAPRGHPMFPCRSRNRTNRFRISISYSPSSALSLLQRRAHSARVCFTFKLRKVLALLAHSFDHYARNINIHNLLEIVLCHFLAEV